MTTACHSDDAAIELSIARQISEGTFGDPFTFLGRHSTPRVTTLRAFVPDALRVEAVSRGARAVIAELEPVSAAPGVFVARLASIGDESCRRLRVWRRGETLEIDDPYQFSPVLGELDEHLISEGAHWRLWDALGAHVIRHEGVEGVHFAVWAPNAQRVSVVGDFNAWDGRRHVMRNRGASGVWEFFLPGIGAGARYKYEIRTRQGEILPLKADPVGLGAEHPPSTASVVRTLDKYTWRDTEWMARRADVHRTDRPVSIYEAHLGSWARSENDNGRRLSYIELAERLVPYVRDLCFTHLELMPISEFPFDGSWGYQPVGLFAPTVRHGTPDDFREFVDACHAAGLGLILDWVPGHFPNDGHGLAHFDGSALYEHADPREGLHPDWNTCVYNHGRREVQNFLIANALYWLKEHHIDGLRVDAVASMLYRDYSRKPGEWIANAHGGRENLEAIAFLRRMNAEVYGRAVGIVTMAEESTAFPGVSRPVHDGGLGFGYKWNMGWMNDTLSYMGRDPVHRRHHHHQMTFGISYAFSENFVLPLSHDEVVHGKGSLLARMSGDSGQKFANLRAYFGFMWAHPGKKLLFMGGEFAQPHEWNHNESLDWRCLDSNLHRGVQTLVQDLNQMYRSTPALYQWDACVEGFRWIVADESELSVFAWVRFGETGSKPVIAVCNFTPVERSDFRIGVPCGGYWRERLNTDASVYGGAGRGNFGGAESAPLARHGYSDSVCIYLPPLSTLIFELA